MKTRRDFIKSSIALGATACALSDISRLCAADTTPASGSAQPILVAVRDGTRTAMLDKALAELGGIERFVKPGQTVVIKPNIGWNTPPDRSADTHPELVGRLTELCLKAGAKSVKVFDNTCNPWRDCYKRSGIEDAVLKAGGEMHPGNDEKLYREINIPQGKVLKSAKIHHLILESDVFINLPILKHHDGSKLSAGMKNLMGIVNDRGFYHRADLHQCIADFLTFKKPDLNILDAFQPMFRNGPRGKSVSDTVFKGMLFASTDVVALDAAGAKVLDYNPSDISHIVMAADLNIGVMDLAKVDVRRFKLA